MNATPDASRRSGPPAAVWAVPDTLPPPPGPAAGSGLAWLSGSAAPHPDGPSGGTAGGTAVAGSPGWPGEPFGPDVGADGLGSPGESRWSETADALPPPGTGRRLETADAFGRPAAAAGQTGSDGGRGWPGAGEVVTWLPDGRWVSAGADGDVAEDDAGHRDVQPDGAVRRRGRRRIALARIGARIAGWPRRVLVAMLLLAAVLLALRPHPAAVPAAPAAPSAAVVVAARDLAAGTVLTAADLRTVSMPLAVVPAGVARRAAGLVGRLAAGAIRRGEALTDARVVGPGLAAGLGPGEFAAVPVRLADPESAALVRAGDRVDVLGTPVAPDGSQAAGGDAVEIAAAVRVLAVLGSRDPADGVVLVVAATEQTARRLAGAAARHRLAVSVRPP